MFFWETQHFCRTEMKISFGRWERGGFVFRFFPSCLFLPFGNSSYKREERKYARRFLSLRFFTSLFSWLLCCFLHAREYQRLFAVRAARNCSGAFCPWIKRRNKFISGAEPSRACRVQTLVTLIVFLSRALPCVFSNFTTRTRISRVFFISQCRSVRARIISIEYSLPHPFSVQLESDTQTSRELFAEWRIGTSRERVYEMKMTSVNARLIIVVITKGAIMSFVYHTHNATHPHAIDSIIYR